MCHSISQLSMVLISKPSMSIQLTLGFFHKFYTDLPRSYRIIMHVQLLLSTENMHMHRSWLNGQPYFDKILDQIVFQEFLSLYVNILQDDILEYDRVAFYLEFDNNIF